MRYSEFLVEYRRDVTAQNYGDKILRAFAAMPPQLLDGDAYYTMSVTPETWSNLRTVAVLANKPELNDHIDTNMRINGKIEEVNIDTAPEILRSNASLIINAVLAYFESKDPTPNKEYTQWIIRMWCQNPNLRFEDINRNDLLGIHYLAKRRRMLRPEDADINRFKNYSEFESAMSKYDIDEIARSEKSTNKGTSELVHEDSDMRIIVPKDVEAACYYGQGTSWCTAATRGTNRFEQYNRTGPLYIILPKKPQYNGEKYQLHFADDQFMDEDDDPVSLSQLVNRFPQFKDWVMKAVPKTKKYLELISDEQLVNYWRTGLQALAPLIDETFFDWEIDDESYIIWKTEKAKARGYVDSDGNIDWDRVNDDPNLNDYSDYNTEYDSALKRVSALQNYSANEIKEIIDEVTKFIRDSSEYPSGPMTVRELDEIYEKAFDNIFMGDNPISSKIRSDLYIGLEKTWGTNRPILTKEVADGYVFALLYPQTRSRR